MWSTLVTSALQWLEPTWEATTAAERTAVYRLRYEVNVEVGVRHSHIDDDARTIHQPADDAPNTVVLATGPKAAPTATVTLRVHAPGTLPTATAAYYQLERLGDVSGHAIVEVNHLAARRAARGSRAITSLTCAAVDHAIRHHQAELLVSSCAPGLLGAYRRLGLRPYGPPCRFDWGVFVPVACTPDPRLLAAVRSPWAHVVRALDAEGLLSPRGYDALNAAIDAADPQRTIDAHDIDTLEQALTGAHASFLSRLPEDVTRLLTTQGFLIEVEPGMRLVEEGVASRDLFVLVDGVVAIERGDRCIATRGPGELIGEVAFFHPGGRRSATVRAETPVRAIALRHGALERLARKHPEAGCAIYASLAAAMADKLARG